MTTERETFFYGNDKANERTGHLMVSDYRRPRPRATPGELQVRCRLLCWRYPCHIDLEILPQAGHFTVAWLVEGNSYLTAQ